MSLKVLQNVVRVCDINISNDAPFTLIAGPCSLESREVAFRVAEALVNITHKHNIPFIFKSSFDKANRTSLHAQRGVPIETAFRIFEELKKEFAFPITTDVHTIEQCNEMAKYVDLLQIPAFLCRQTDLLVAAAKTGRPINVKKGQFLSPNDMENVLKKIVLSGNQNILLCERGACFGYNRLVSDMRSIKIMSDFGYPVVFDATHSVQEPGGLGDASGGNRGYVELLSRAAISVGVAALFIETHFDPKNAFSDGPNMVPLNVMDNFVGSMKKFDELAKNSLYQDMSC